MNRILAGALVSFLIPLLGQGFAYAAEYPNRPIRIVVPFPAGGGADTVARLVGQKLTASFGQQMVVDNRTGAGGIIGTDMVAKANPDGYTLCLTFVSHAINPFVYVKLPYDTVRDFAPIAFLAVSPNAVTVTPSFPAKSIKELIALAKAQPGKINYASAGVGTNSHLSGEMLNFMAGIELVHIAYKGGPPANAAVLAGEAQLTIPSLEVSMPLITSGRLRAIAVTSANRAAVLPDVPTVAETLPGFESLAWYGVLAPVGTPRAVITRLTTEIEKILRMPDVIESLSKRGADPTYKDPAQFADYINSELKRWGDTVKAAGLKPGNI